jgi:Winged helix DNA-binding domain
VTGIAGRRLRAQRLTGEPFASPVEAVRWLGAMQSQDYAAAKWALGQRCRRATEAELDRLFDDGAILRTHVMRPTWHFVLPEDVRWLLDLTAPRIRPGLAARHRELGLDDVVIARAGSAFATALDGGRHLTRAELGGVLRAAGISPDGQRLPHLLMQAELDRLIVSGPRHGKQFTYALLEERVPKARVKDRTHAIAELSLRYFRSHGPAQVHDFAWWSGLTVADCRTGIALAGSALDHQAIEGKDYWFDAKAGPIREARGVAHLLPNYDEYTVAYRDRGAVVHPDREFEPALFAFGSILANLLTIGGLVRGSWRRTIARGSVRLEIRRLGRLEPAEAAAVERAGRRMGRFLERSVEIAWQ